MIPIMIVVVVIATFVIAAFTRDSLSEAGWAAVLATLVSVLLGTLISAFLVAAIPATRYSEITPAQVVTENATQVVLRHGENLTTVDRDDLKYDNKCEGSNYRIEQEYTKSWVALVPILWGKRYVSCVDADLD